MIRELRKEDIPKLKEIHGKFFEDEFDFPDFLNGYLCAFVSVSDDSNDIICAGGVRHLAELVAITDKTKSARERRRALYEILSVGLYISEKHGHDSLHAFIQDPMWLYQLKQRGFMETVGKSLYMPCK